MSINIPFKVIGVDDVEDNSSVRFRCSTSKDGVIFIGSDSTNSTGHVWKYSNESWERITGNLELNNFRSINSILVDDEDLFVGTGRNYLEFGKGQVWVNKFSNWQNTGNLTPLNSNTLIRKIIKLNNDVYAAGSFYSIYKYDGSSWTAPVNEFLSNTDLFNWIDIETDGSSIYGSVVNITASSVSGVICYDFSSVKQDALPGFGNSNNFFVSKFHYDGTYLYAGTYNEVSGTEIWRRNPQTKTWSKINQSGFGNFNNYMTVDMKTINGSLVVSVANVSGGEVYAYDISSLAWYKQQIQSDVIYDEYLIESTSGKNYLIGRSILYFAKITDHTLIYTREQLNSKYLWNWSDGIGGAIPIGNDEYRFVTPSQARFTVTEGTLDDPAKRVISPVVNLSSINANSPLSFYFSSCGNLTTTFNASAPYALNDILQKKPDIASGLLNTFFTYLSCNSGVGFYHVGPCYKDPNTGLVLATCYTEEGYWQDQNLGLSWLMSTRLAVSFDDGLSFYDCGYILTPHLLTRPGTSFDVANGPYPNSSIMKIDDYFYLFYSGDRDLSSSPATCLAVARAPYSEVIQSALVKQASPWKKYYNDSFSENGLGGKSKTSLDLSFPSFTGRVYYSSKYKKLVVLSNSPVFFLDSNLYVINFINKFLISVGSSLFQLSYQKILNLGNGVTDYSNPIADDDYKGEINNLFSNYIVSGPRSSLGWGAIQYSKFDGSSIHKVNLNKNRSYSIGNYLPNFTLDESLTKGQLHPFVATLHYIQEQSKILQASSYYDDNLNEYSQNNLWKNNLQSYANSLTNSGISFPNSFNDYITYKFGKDFHNLYCDYTNNFNRHRMVPTTTLLNGPTIFGHTFGSILLNSDLNQNGTVTNSNLEFITSSLSSTVELKPYNILFSTSGSASGCYIASSTSEVLLHTESGNRLSEFRNSGILSHVEFIHPSAASVDNSFAVIRLDKNNRASYGYNRILYENTLIKQQSTNSYSRFVFDVRKYPADSNLGYDVSTNFLTPNHKFKLSLKTLIASKNGLRLGGGSVSVWIHTKPERNRIWTYTKDGVWVQHLLTDVKESNLVSTYCHVFSLPEVQRQLSGVGCTNFLITDNLNRENDVIASVQENEFTSFDLEFNTENKQIELTVDYFDNVSQSLHRLNQNYVIEIFSNNRDIDKFTLFYDINLVDLTLNKWSKPFVAGKSNGSPFDNYCKEYRVDINRNHLMHILKYFNEINGAYNQFGYASRVASYTSGVYEASGGSRINYVESPEWSTNSKSSQGSLINIISLNN